MNFLTTLSTHSAGTCSMLNVVALLASANLRYQRTSERPCLRCSGVTSWLMRETLLQGGDPCRCHLPACGQRQGLLWGQLNVHVGRFRMVELVDGKHVLVRVDGQDHAQARLGGAG